MASSTTSESVEYTAAPRKAERSSFSQTCSLLSQYLKEKGSFGELSLGMAAANFQPNTPPPLPATNLRESTRRTMNLFPGGVEAPPMDSNPTRNPGHCSGTLLRSMDLFPQQACSAPYDSSVVNKSVQTIGEPQPSQMTIFYGGQVIVFEDFPADKARELMLMAGQGSFPSQSVFPPSHMVGESPVEPTAMSPMSSGFNTIPIQPNTPPMASDLPLARRASLHRFLEKRKDRITSKAPYQINSPMLATSKQEMENRAWLGLAGPQ